MGSNGNMSVPTEHKKDPLKRRPFTNPPFTLSDLKKAIPPHCFNRSVIRSFSYVVRDLVLVSIFYYVATTYFHRLPSSYRYLAWPIYWIAQGCIFGALWVIGHECGHRAFSDYQWVDDIVGFIIHSSILTPYFSWKYSHRRHHSNTGSLDHDEAHVPRRKSKLKWYTKYLNNPVGRAVSLVYTLSLGWPSYLTFNAFGRSDDSFASHYDPYSVLYNDRERLQIIVSDAGIIATFYVLYRIALVKGLAWLVCIYGVPLLISNSLVMIVSYLNHTHPSLPRYDSSEWDWLRGALTTADRDIGIFNKVFHNGSNTHVIHHLFTFMPHYHAVEATKAIKPILGDYYQCDDTFVFKALWRDTNSCIYVEKDEGCEDRGVYWFNKEL